MTTDLTADSPIEARVPEIIRLLRAHHPDAHCELNYRTPFQLLIATILSAQTTDVRVNMVTPALFARFPDAQSLAVAQPGEIEEIIRSIGFFRQKARFLRESAQLLVEKHGGAVPNDMAALTALPGVARKTANVVLGEVFHIAEGVVVDTHVKRLANRLGLTASDDPKQIERDLMRIIPQDEWIMISHLLIFHGRRVCPARKPDCAECKLNQLCPAAFTFTD